MQLRPYQLRACEQARQAARDGSRAVCIVAPTGSGKTVIACELVRTAHAKRSRVLWLAHRHELIEQARAKLTVPATVATVQGLLASGERPEAEVVVWDEIHHAPAQEWRQLAQHYAGSMLLGLTATPERGDGVPLGDICDAMVVAARHSELLADGWLVPADVYGPPQVQRGGELGNDVIETWRARAATMRTICFAQTVVHAEELAQRWTMAGVRAEVVEGNTPGAERAAVLARFASGETQVVCNVHLLTEGFDLPSIECVVLASGCSTVSAYLQKVGRALRPSPGKTLATVLDMAGTARDPRFGMPDEDREYSLEGRAIRSAVDRSEKPLRQCKWCGAAWAGLEPTCPRCGRRVARPRTPRERREAIERIQASHGVDRRKQYYQQLCAQAQAKGYKRGWAAFRYKARYGTWPGGGG